jgi:hypothetical protein
MATDRSTRALPPDKPPLHGARRAWRHRRSLSLTPTEAKHLRETLHKLALAYGGAAKLAGKLGVASRTLTHPSPGLAVAGWRVTRMPVEMALTGKLDIACLCLLCGATPGGGAS